MINNYYYKPRSRHDTTEGMESYNMANIRKCIQSSAQVKV